VAEDRAIASVPSAGHPELARLVGFGRYLRRTGLPVGTGRILTFCRAAAALEPLGTEDLRLAARATLVSRPDHLAALDAAFDRYFRPTLAEPAGPPESSPRRRDATPVDTGAGDEGREISVATPSWSLADVDEDLEGEAALRVVASEAELLRHKDFAELTDPERRRVLAMVRHLAMVIPTRRARRLRPSRDGDRFDLRRTIRWSLRTEGEPFRRAYRERRIRTRPLVLILDVSGSMAAYSRVLLEFAHAASRAGRRVEVFCFGTRLTRITRALRERDPGAAMDAVSATVVDWEGGTRIGASLKELLDRWASRSALRGSVVLLCSDGLERGDPDLLAVQMGRLSRLVHRVVWVNPLKGSPRYEPLARGMAASLPFVDVFLPGHSLDSLEKLAEAVALS
jgi:uncharacterized protein with von Willebrand factor type A (vWA) domain